MKNNKEIEKYFEFEEDYVNYIICEIIAKKGLFKDFQV